MGVEIWVLLVTVVVLALLYSRRRLSHWSSMGVSGPPAVPFFGHFHKEYFLSSNSIEYYQKNYDEYYKSSMFGLYEFFRPVLVLYDPELLKLVMVKDFDHFSEPRDFQMDTGNEIDNVMMEMLFLKKGAEWKNLRSIMTPTFTSGKIKNMFPLVIEKADLLVKHVLQQAAQDPKVDIKANFGRFTIDTIGSVAFGIECNSMTKESNEFPLMADAFFKFSIPVLLKMITFKFFPRLFRLTGLNVNPSESIFFINIAKQTLEARRAGNKRGDFLDLLLEAQENSDNTDKKQMLSDITLVAQTVIFIVAGYATTASLLSFTSFLLAKNKDQQQRLRDEVRQLVEEHGEINYQGIMEAKLLEACLQESLRIYPPAIVTERACTKTYTLPGTNITLRPGDVVEIPIWHIHHDPKHWPDPEAFIPDRFLPENKNNIHPYTHLPFGMGPRNCIGMRFAMMEAKIALAKILLDAELDLAPGHDGLDFVAEGGLLGFKKGVTLLVKPIKE